MNNTTNEYDLTIGKIMKKREELKDEQREGRNLLHEKISEKKEVRFVPSDYWQRKIDANEKHALAGALDDEDVEPISYLTDEMESREGRILSIGLNKDELIVIRVQDIKTEEEVDVLEENTWDVDYLLEFIQRFGER